MSAPRDHSEQQRALALADLLRRRRDDVVGAWVRIQSEGAGARGAVEDTRVLEAHDGAFIDALLDGLQLSGRIYDPVGHEFEPLRAIVGEASQRGAREGLAPAETAHSVLALREALGGVMSEEYDDPAELQDGLVTSARLVDSLALLSFEVFVRSREEVIAAQVDQLAELSTPVVRLWDGVIAVPLIGTLDSARAQVVMEALLQAIVDENALVAIVDITGVPTFDTLVAQNLLKTVTATRLMGADCIVSGIRPQTAQTIVQLGIDLAEITTRATLADALKTAIRRVHTATGDPAVQG